MVAKLLRSHRFRRIFFSFPLQLVFLHLKHNYLLLFFWLILFGFVTGGLGDKFGVPNLFMYPEYLGEVGFWSFLIIGFSCGGFIMAFNIASYIMNGFRFPFIATISRPFMKYSLNNFVIPLSFVITYISLVMSFQLNKELLPLAEVLKNITGFLTGTIFFIIIAFSYFLSTNKDLFKLFGIGTEDDFLTKTSKFKPVIDVFHKNEKWHKRKDKSSEWYIETYLSSPFKIMLARDCTHYDRAMLDGVFQQNHLNAAFFEIAVFISLLILGFFRESTLFLIPAGATIFLLFTMFIMLSSALHSWLKDWSTFVLIVLFLLFNYISRYEWFSYENQVYGLNYNIERAEYTNESLKEHSADFKQQQIDIANNIEILNKWRIKNSPNSLQRNKKPKLVIISCSGGGLRASLWTLYSMQFADSILKGELMKHTQLITGSSGGLIGAAYMREIYLRSFEDENINIYDSRYRDNIGKDLLNPIAFTIAVNDMFFRLQKFTDGEYTYTKERGYAFERQLNINTDYYLNRRLVDYIKPELEARIPLMIFSPTIINEGRRLVVASQGVSYMTNNFPQPNLRNQPLPESVEFTRFFRKQDALNTLFTSALRMNATFPYVLPVTSLPSKPAIEIMDGGIRDNYGLKSVLNYMYTFRNWISTNTSGVVIIQTRDKFKEFPVDDKPPSTTMQSITTPLGSFYENFDKIQNFNHDELLQFTSSWFDGEIDIVDFQLNDKEQKISLSWHLTTKEKKAVIESMRHPDNQQALKRLKELLD
jgi:hypothetical protein